ncbi:MAG: hypothetical protein ACOCXX_05265, partial [Planctomycetota bacterium]
FFLALLAIALVREVVGSGKLLGMGVFPEGMGYQAQSVLVLAPGAFLVIGSIFALIGLRRNRQEQKQMMAVYARVGQPMTATDVKRQREQAKARAEARKKE